jgi:trans-aconitate methyltransferase
MKSRILTLLFLVIASIVVANQDPWKGDEYAKHSNSQQASAADFLQGMSLEGVKAILDVGSGDGKITAAMAQLVPDGTVVGVDISPSMVEVAKTRFASVNNLHFQIQDAAKIEFEEQFDLITSFTVMQWVLEQAEALRRFEKALKPGGRLWIQMPTGLPKAMEQALERTISSDAWRNDFAQFKAPWRFYQPEEYKTVLQEARFQMIRLTVVSKHEKFPSRAAFHGFLKQWFPYLRPIAAEKKDLFLTDLLDRYLEALPPDELGKVSFIVDRLEVEAVKSSNIKE